MWFFTLLSIIKLSDDVNIIIQHCPGSDWLMASARRPQQARTHTHTRNTEIERNVCAGAQALCVCISPWCCEQNDLNAVIIRAWRRATNNMFTHTHTQTYRHTQAHARDHAYYIDRESRAVYPWHRPCAVFTLNLCYQFESKRKHYKLSHLSAKLCRCNMQAAACRTAVRTFTYRVHRAHITRVQT